MSLFGRACPMIVSNSNYWRQLIRRKNRNLGESEMKVERRKATKFGFLFPDNLEQIFQERKKSPFKKLMFQDL